MKKQRTETDICFSKNVYLYIIWGLTALGFDVCFLFFCFLDVWSPGDLPITD
jgi:hypothetical protein